MIGRYDFYFAQPWWLLAAALAVPVVWLARRSLSGLGRARRIIAIGLRVLVVLLLAIILARPVVAKKGTQLTLITVLDRSQSVPEELQKKARPLLLEGLVDGRNRLVPEAALRSQLTTVYDSYRASRDHLLIHDQEGMPSLAQWMLGRL